MNVKFLEKGNTNLADLAVELPATCMGDADVVARGAVEHEESPGLRKHLLQWDGESTATVDERGVVGEEPLVAAAARRERQPIPVT